MSKACPVHRMDKLRDKDKSIKKKKQGIEQLFSIYYT